MKNSKCASPRGPREEPKAPAAAIGSKNVKVEGSRKTPPSPKPKGYKREVDAHYIV